MASMLVNSRSAKKCCRGCSVDFGTSCKRKPKQQLKRTIRRREKQKGFQDGN